MPESNYDVIQLIGTGDKSWEKAAANAVEQASKSLRHVRHRRNRRTRYATGREGKGRSISREGQAIVQTRGLLKSQRVGTAQQLYCAISPLLPASHHGVRQLLRQRRIRFNVKRSWFSGAACPASR